MLCRSYRAVCLTLLCVGWQLLLGASAAQISGAAGGAIQPDPGGGQNLQTGTFPFVDVQVRYVVAGADRPGAPVVLFLHGKAFTSDVWVRLGTLQHIADAGFFTAIAVDLPGYGATRDLPYVDNNMRAEFIKTALEFVVGNSSLTSMLVSPSMSGRWAIPFLERYGQMLGGWVAVAPVGVSGWGGPWEFTHKQVKLLAVYGEKDGMASDGPYLTKLFQQAELVSIPGAGHACYLDQPDAFHAALLKFVKSVDPTSRVEDKYGPGAFREL